MELRNGLGAELGRMGTTWGSEIGTPSPAYGCLSNCNQIAPVHFYQQALCVMGWTLNCNLG